MTDPRACLDAMSSFCHTTGVPGMSWRRALVHVRDLLRCANGLARNAETLWGASTISTKVASVLMCEEKSTVRGPSSPAGGTSSHGHVGSWASRKPWAKHRGPSIAGKSHRAKTFGDLHWPSASCPRSPEATGNLMDPSHCLAVDNCSPLLRMNFLPKWMANLGPDVGACRPPSTWDLWY